MNKIELLNGKIMLEDWKHNNPNYSEIRIRNILLKLGDQYLEVGEILLCPYAHESEYREWFLDFCPNLFNLFDLGMPYEEELILKLQKFLDIFPLNGNKDLNIDEIKNQADELIKKFDIWLIYE